MLDARCAYCANSIRLRTATAGGGKSVDVKAPPAASPPEGVLASPEAFFKGGRSGGTEEGDDEEASGLPVGVEKEWRESTREGKRRKM